MMFYATLGENSTLVNASSDVMSTGICSSDDFAGLNLISPNKKEQML